MTSAGSVNDKAECSCHHVKFLSACSELLDILVSTNDCKHTDFSFETHCFVMREVVKHRRNDADVLGCYNDKMSVCTCNKDCSKYGYIYLCCLSHLFQ